MKSFRFVHAADLHLDSPLLGLRGKSQTWAAQVERASRQAFEALVALAQTQNCRFVVLAGDVFDGALRNYQTGLFFMAGMRTLGEAGIDVFVILGNHDAENQFAKQLPLAKNVKVFSADMPQSFRLDDVGVSVHGQSFAQRDVTDNLARAYPAPSPGDFNIGVLHTACQGSEQHALYAPCSVEQLVHHGYDYWALGHIHARAILHEYPHVVYPGNLQGRSPKETGGKGATVVAVAHGRVEACTHHDLDAVRWQQARIDVQGIDSLDEVLERVRHGVQQAVALAKDRPVALRIYLEGPSQLHTMLQLQSVQLSQKIETLLEAISGNLWLERLRVATTPHKPDDAPLDPSVSGELTRLIQAAVADGTAAALVQTRLKELRDKMPAGAEADALVHRLTKHADKAAAELAYALIDDKASCDATA